MNQPIHVGYLIQNKFEELYPGKTQMWLAEKMNRTDRTVRNYFEKQSMRIKDIKMFSELLGYNFLAELNHNNFEELDNLTLTEIETYLAAQISKAYHNYKKTHPECTQRWLAGKLCVTEKTLSRMLECAKVDDALLRKLSNLLDTNLFTPIAGLLNRHLDEVKAGRAGLLSFTVRDAEPYKFTLYSEDCSRCQVFDLLEFLFNAGMMEKELSIKD